jgi:hypothetical protein
MSDQWEWRYREKLDPLDPNDAGPPNELLQSPPDPPNPEDYLDTEGNLLDNYHLLYANWEASMIPHVKIDADLDRLSNLTEFILGSHPLIPDSDGDGYSDGSEFANGSSPTNATSLPLIKLSSRGGNNQSTQVETVAPLQLSVQAERVHTAVRGLPITFTASGITSGQISLSQTGPWQSTLTITSDSSGSAQVFWKAPGTPGTSTVRATTTPNSFLSPVDFTLTATSSGGGGGGGGGSGGGGGGNSPPPPTWEVKTRFSTGNFTASDEQVTGGDGTGEVTHGSDGPMPITTLAEATNGVATPLGEFQTTQQLTWKLSSHYAPAGGWEEDPDDPFYYHWVGGPEGWSGEHRQVKLARKPGTPVDTEIVVLYTKTTTVNGQVTNETGKLTIAPNQMESTQTISAWANAPTGGQTSEEASVNLTLLPIEIIQAPLDESTTPVLASTPSGTPVTSATGPIASIPPGTTPIQPPLAGGNMVPTSEIRFCRWLDSFPGGSFDNKAADNDRDRFRIKIAGIIPNLTKARIKSTDLHGAVVGGQFVNKTTDGDYEVEMKADGGAMVSTPILLVSDGEDDKSYNGKGTDDHPDDQTLLADFESKIVITFPELSNAQVEFTAQKAVGEITVNLIYGSVAGDVPNDIREAIYLQAHKMREIYRQIGIKVKFAALNGAQIPAPWLAPTGPPGDPDGWQKENHLIEVEGRLFMQKLKDYQVPAKQIRVGFVNATLESPNYKSAFGWGYLGQEPVIVSIKPLGGRERIGTMAHEVGHVFDLPDLSSGITRLMFESGLPWKKSHNDSKRFQEGDPATIKAKGDFYAPLR